MDVKEIERKFTPKIDNFICYNTHLRIINQVIYEECFRTNGSKWAPYASARLIKEFGIYRADDTLERMLRNIRNGSRPGVALSSFANKMSSRYEKDVMYSKVEMLIHEHLDDDLSYIGLPANQIISLIQKYTNVWAYEVNKDTFKFMSFLNKIMDKRAMIVNDDIFSFVDLPCPEDKFNIFDFDLMCALNENLIDKIINMLCCSAKNISVVSIISIGGRHISTKEYNYLVPILYSKISNNFNIKTLYSGRYKDLKFPMRYELFVLESK
jgi:hypothetical protein